MEPTSINSTRTYLDFDGLAQLKGQARQDAKAATRETAQQFEALFLQMMMKSMRESVIKDDSIENKTIDTYESMFDKEVSLQMAKRNSVGLADMLVKNLEAQQAASVSTAEILKMRQEGGLPPAKAISLNPKVVSMPLEQANKPVFNLPKPGAIPLNLGPMLLDRSGT
ncbi:MAG: hypothetical protein EBQ86_14755 [Betaproteobacteria bacterium]|nr:hypothetical protein [Betaproteobacteria bacterium]